MEHLVCLGDVTAWPQGDFGSYPQRGLSSVTLPPLAPIFEALLNTEDVSKVILEFDGFLQSIGQPRLLLLGASHCLPRTALSAFEALRYLIASFLTFILISYLIPFLAEMILSSPSPCLFLTAFLSSSALSSSSVISPLSVFSLLTILSRSSSFLRLILLSSSSSFRSFLLSSTPRCPSVGWFLSIHLQPPSYKQAFLHLPFLV